MADVVAPPENRVLLTMSRSHAGELCTITFAVKKTAMLRKLMDRYRQKQVRALCAPLRALRTRTLTLTQPQP